MNSNLKECEICFEKIICKGKINSCDHHFHYKCIYRWSKILNNCPTCRSSFSEILKEFDGKTVKKIQLNENCQFFDEEFFNVDDEDWQVFCSKCHLPQTNSLITCKGSFSCTNVVHRYCLDSDIDATKWLCPKCVKDYSFSESSVAESSDENFEEESFETTQSSVIVLDSQEKDVILLESEKKVFEVNEYLIEDQEGGFINQQIISFEIPFKRNREKGLNEGLERFIREKVQKELLKKKLEKLSWSSISKTLNKIIIRNNPKPDLQDRRTSSSIKNFIRSYIAGIV